MHTALMQIMSADANDRKVGRGAGVGFLCFGACGGLLCAPVQFVCNHFREPAASVRAAVWRNAGREIRVTRYVPWQRRQPRSRSEPGCMAAGLAGRQGGLEGFTLPVCEREGRGGGKQVCRMRLTARGFRLQCVTFTAGPLGNILCFNPTCTASTPRLAFIFCAHNEACN